MATYRHFKPDLERFAGQIARWQARCDSAARTGDMEAARQYEQDVKDLTQALKDAVYARKKDFGEIKRLTKELKTRIERPLPQTAMAF